MWDVGGQKAIRLLWRHYYLNTNGIIFVVDSANPERLQEARESLKTFETEEELLDVPILILANKNDLHHKSVV